MDFETMDSSMFDHSKLRGRIVEKFGTLEEFYKYLPYTPNMAYRKVNGKSGLSRMDIMLWSELLEIAIEDIGSYFFVLKV